MTGNIRARLGRLSPTEPEAKWWATIGSIIVQPCTKLRSFEITSELRPVAMEYDAERVDRILLLARASTPENVGDTYTEALELHAQVNSEEQRAIATLHLSSIRSLARRAEIGWRLFARPPIPNRALSEDDQIQLIILVSTLHSFGFGVEALDEASALAGPDSTPVRFYINSIYHYIAAMYLLDKGADPMGGMVYKTIAPMGLADLLQPIKGVLDQPKGAGISFGETIRRIRNDFLVHGAFSPDDVAVVVKSTNLHDNTQVLRLTELIWELFNRSMILKLQLIAVLTAGGTDIHELATHYVSRSSGP